MKRARGSGGGPSDRCDGISSGLEQNETNGTTNWMTGAVKCELVRTGLLTMMGRFACTLSMIVALLEFVAY